MPRPFDRKPTSSGNGKKAAVAGVLAVALAVVLVRQLSPARLSPASTPDAAGAPLVEETTAQALENLINDPTKDLLRAESTERTKFDSAPSDPFQMSASWRASLLKLDTKTPDVTPNIVAAVSPVKTADQRPTAPLFDPGALKLQGVFKDKARSYAIVNGSIVREGNTVAGARITAINDDHILIQPLGATEATQFEVYLKRR